MATISNTPRPGYVWDSTDDVWYPIGTGPHTHADYITSGSAINPNVVDAKGDIIAASAADTVARLAVGANDTVLTADSSEATGLKWATPAAGGMTLISTTTLTGSTVTLSSISQDYTRLFIAYDSVQTTALNQFRMRFNGDTGSNYLYGWIGAETGYSLGQDLNTQTYIYVFTSTDTSTALEKRAGFINIENYTSSDQKHGNFQGTDRRGSSPQQYEFNVGSFNYVGSAITSIELYMGAGTFTTGTVKLYGVK
jgi:hypothetical protein